MNSQDLPVKISSDQLNGSNQIFLGQLEGWKLKIGNEENCAKPNLNTSDWQDLSLPLMIDEEYIGDQQFVEGWLRLKIQLDDSFQDSPLNLNSQIWMPYDLYIDGYLVHSFGSIGSDQDQFQRYNHQEKYPIPVLFQSDSTHTIAIHFKDVFQRFIHPPESQSISAILNLGNAEVYESIAESNRRNYLLWTSITVFCAVLTILFLLLYYINREDNYLGTITVCTAFLCGNALFWLLSTSGSIIHNAFVVCVRLGMFSFIGVMSIAPLVVSHTIKGQISRELRIGMLLSGVVFYVISVFTNDVIAALYVVLSFAMIIYILYQSRRDITGSKSAIAIGILSTPVLFLLVVILLVTTQNNINEFLSYVFFALLFLCWTAIPISLLIYVSMRFKEKNNEISDGAQRVVAITEEKRQQALNQNAQLEIQVKERTTELTKSLDNLKSTQAQLIQSEKMASLGELTAGIAHEIQNPLNFVNNFSEVNMELVDEINEELNEGNVEEVRDILADLKSNTEKVSHHGKRADSIVKGMLQHSRTSSGEKVPTDINALCDEYLRLAYHGIRAKEKSFNATLETHFDSSLPQIDIIRQDIGRVVLNLMTNAFQAMMEVTTDGYQPALTITTSTIPHTKGVTNGREITINIKDNGPGIPQAIADKIFLPFFTTKPTGSGTGLGLSISYDIVQAHGGELKVESKEGEGTTFLINIPINN